MPLVLDASVAVAWAFAEEAHPLAALTRELLGAEEAHVPSLWWFEVRNALIINERRRRLTKTDTAAFVQILARLPISADMTPNEARLLELSRGHKLTVYDAAYLELAQREDLPLATLDAELARAAGVEKVPMIGRPPAGH